MSKPNYYLCQFREEGRDYFVTDCAFYSDQLDAAISYVERVVSTLAIVVEGKVWNVEFKYDVYSFARPPVGQV